MDNKQVYIDKPCTENWETMTPNGQGRHCRKCCKTVIDFSGWKTEDIISYISSSKQSVCGQVSADQAVIPAHSRQDVLKRIVQAPLPFIRKVAAVIVICFGLLGDYAFAQQRDPQKQPQRPMILGGMRAPVTKDTTHKNNEQDLIKGEIAAPEQADTAKTCAPVKTVMGKVRADYPNK